MSQGVAAHESGKITESPIKKWQFRKDSNLCT